jgi:hypothetical protein
LLAFTSNILVRLSEKFFASLSSQFVSNQNKKSLISLSLFSFSLDSGRKIRFGMLKDREREKTGSGRGRKGKLILILSAVINENSNE